MANDGQIVFEVTADGKHAIADIKDITRQIEQETKKWDKSVEESTDKMDSSFSGLIKKLSVAAIGAGIISGLKNIASAAIETASDLAEVQNVVDTTFGTDSNKIEKWAKSAGEQFGLTELQAKRFSSTMGAMLKSSGLAGEQITEMSTTLSGLAADMASFYNLDFDTAFQKIRSGISGETEPLKQLGINMSTANLEAFALQKGLEKTWNEMSQGEQIMLRYQYMMQATADAQGDFAKTADGYANANRRIESAIDSIKTSIGKFLLPTVEYVTNALANFFEQITTPLNRTVLDDFNEIDVETSEKLAQIDVIKKEAQDTADLLDRIFGKSEEDPNGTKAAEIIAKYGINADETTKFLESLGYSTDEITEKQETWLEVCKRLVKTIPGLNEIINTETGEVKGGRAAIDQYINAWEQGQKKIALLQAQERRRQALAASYTELPGYEVDMLLWQDRLQNAKKQLEKMMKDYGINKTIEEMGTFEAGSAYATGNGPGDLGLTYEQSELLSKEKKYYDNVLASANKATSTWKEQYDAYQDALKILEDGDRVIEETYGDTEDAAQAAADWSDELKQAGTTAVQNLSAALTAIEDHVNGVRESTAKAIDSVIKGFSEVETPMMKNRKQIKDLTDEMGNLDSTSKDYKDQLKKINDEINKTKGQQISAQSMSKSLEQQAKYMEDYLANLRKARELGVSNEVLAALSDGSEESYDYLEALANASPAEVEKINASYQSVIDKKKELTEELTGQQLTVDQVYQQMLADAKEAVAALDLGEEAKTNSGKTVAGLAQGIADHVTDVQAAVDSILEQLNKLSSWGVNIDFGPFGSVPISTGGNLTTTEESKVRNGIGTPQYTVDYDTIGNAMRDNVKPGGNVYLDGRVVGAVISEQQGKTYRQLQRSGWQG